MDNPDLYIRYIIKSVIEYPGFGITAVHKLEGFRYMFYNRDQYSTIISLIQQEDWEGLKSIEGLPIEGFREYLDIIKFSDQNGNLYTATVYDSDELWENPGVIDIFKRKK